MPKHGYYDGDTFERGGRWFKVAHPVDEFGRTPWEDDDGTGIVSEWTTRNKEPGERVLASDGRSKLYYDFAATVVKAKKQGWGLTDDDKAKLADSLGRKPTKKQIVTQAVEQDYEHLRRWCNNQWCYVGVVVTLIDEEGDEQDETESVWGIESDCDEYMAQTAHELADEINQRLDASFAERTEQSRPDMRL